MNGCAAYLGCLSGVLLVPDLDLDGEYTIDAERRLRRFSRLLAWLWEAFWRPYGLLPHRSRLSHAPFIGTAVRLLYLSVPYWVLCWHQHALLLPPGWAYAPLAAAVIGLACADLLHWLLDTLHSRRLHRYEFPKHRCVVRPYRSFSRGHI